MGGRTGGTTGQGAGHLSREGTGLMTGRAEGRTMTGCCLYFVINFVVD